MTSDTPRGGGKGTGLRAAGATGPVMAHQQKMAVPGARAKLRINGGYHRIPPRYLPACCGRRREGVGECGEGPCTC